MGSCRATIADGVLSDVQWIPLPRLSEEGLGGKQCRGSESPLDSFSKLDIADSNRVHDRLDSGYGVKLNHGGSNGSVDSALA